ncbi:MAG: stage III sporulation protein AE [Blautia sp.]
MRGRSEAGRRIFTKRRKRLLLLLLTVWVFCTGVTVWAQEEAQPQAETAEDGTAYLMEELNLDEIQEAMDRLLEDNSFSLTEMMEKLMSGQMSLDKDTVVLFLRGIFLEQFSRERAILLQIFLLVLVAAVFSNFTSMFQNGQIGEISFYVIYLLLFVLLMESFQSMSSQLESSLRAVVAFMQGLAPAYFLAIAASNGATTAAVFYEMVLLLVWLIQWLMITFVLPAANLSVLLNMVNHLSKEDLLSKLSELLRTLVDWALKTMLGVVAGMQIIQSLVAPVIDSLKRSAIGKTASALPGVGNAFNAVTEIVVTAAVLVRNCLGVTFVIILAIWGLTPLIQYALMSLTYRLMSALTQPVSDPRMVGCLSIMGDGCGLLLRILLTTQVLCMVTIVILAVTFGGSG